MRPRSASIGISVGWRSAQVALRFASADPRQKPVAPSYFTGLSAFVYQYAAFAVSGHIVWNRSNFLCLIDSDQPSLQRMTWAMSSCCSLDQLWAEPDVDHAISSTTTPAVFVMSTSGTPRR